MQEKQRIAALQSSAEGGTMSATEHVDYSPQDLAKYIELKKRQAELLEVGVTCFHPEGREVWEEFEILRNKYNGNPPRQLLSQKLDERSVLFKRI